MINFDHDYEFDENLVGLRFLCQHYLLHEDEATAHLIAAGLEPEIIDGAVVYRRREAHQSLRAATAVQRGHSVLASADLDNEPLPGTTHKFRGGGWNGDDA